MMEWYDQLVCLPMMEWYDQLMCFPTLKPQLVKVNSSDDDNCFESRCCQCDLPAGQVCLVTC
jgi:hypothetical protein